MYKVYQYKHVNKPTSSTLYSFYQSQDVHKYTLYTQVQCTAFTSASIMLTSLRQVHSTQGTLYSFDQYQHVHKSSPGRLNSVFQYQHVNKSTQGALYNFYKYLHMYMLRSLRKVHCTASTCTIMPTDLPKVTCTLYSVYQYQQVYAIFSLI